MIRENPGTETDVQREQRLRRGAVEPVDGGHGDRGLIDRDPMLETEPAVRRQPTVETERQTVYSTSGINIVAGLWLILAPAALGYAGVEAALWNSVVVGIAVAAMAILRVVRPLEFEGVSWTNFILGIWLVVSPFVLGLWDLTPMVWNNIIVGIVILALAATSARATRALHETRPRWAGEPRP